MNKIKTLLTRIAFSIERAFWYPIYLVRYLWQRFVLRNGVFIVNSTKDDLRINEVMRFDRNGGDFRIIWKRKKHYNYLYYIQRL